MILDTRVAPAQTFKFEPEILWKHVTYIILSVDEILNLNDLLQKEFDCIIVIDSDGSTEMFNNKAVTKLTISLGINFKKLLRPDLGTVS